MAKALQRRRGTTEEHKSFTGLEGEFTYDTTEKRIVAHDGATAGGIPMAKASEVASAKTELEGKITAIDVGVTSFNGSKGAVTYSAPVSSVNGKTGAVTVDVGVTSVNGQTGSVTVGTVRSVNGTNADTSGNVTISVPATPKAYVTETYKNGATWYRKWSDGWIEQGGRFTVSGDWQKITLNTAFSSTKYTICGNGLTEGNWHNPIIFDPNSTSSFRAYSYSSSGPTSWYACGY